MVVSHAAKESAMSCLQERLTLIECPSKLAFKCCLVKKENSQYEKPLIIMNHNSGS